MHIIFLTYGMYPEEVAGMQIGTHFMAQELARRGHQVTVVVTRRKRGLLFYTQVSPSSRRAVQPSESSKAGESGSLKVEKSEHRNHSTSQTPRFPDSQTPRPPDCSTSQPLDSSTYYEVYRLPYIDFPFLRFPSECLIGFSFLTFFLCRFYSMGRHTGLPLLHAQCLSPAGLLAALLKKVFPHLKTVVYLYGRDITISREQLPVLIRKVQDFKTTFLHYGKKVVGRWVLQNVDLVLTATQWAKKQAEKVIKGQRSGIREKVQSSKFKVRNQNLEPCTLNIQHPISNIHLFYSGFDYNLFAQNPLTWQEARHHLGLPQNAFLILFVGRLIHDKGVDLLFNAFQELVRSRKKVYAVVIGTGPEEKTLKRLARELQIEDHVLFAGFKDNPELKPYVYAADVLVLPSRVEPFGVVLLEAMACGLPVMGTRIMGIPELIEDRRNGLLVEPENVSSLAHTLQELMENPLLAQTLGHYGREKARAFDWPQRVNEIEQYYLYFKKV